MRVIASKDVIVTTSITKSLYVFQHFFYKVILFLGFIKEIEILQYFLVCAFYC